MKMDNCIIHNIPKLANLDVCELCLIEENEDIYNNGYLRYFDDLLSSDDNETINGIENEEKLISNKLNENSKIYLYQELNNECSICLKYFIFNDIVRELNCNHKYHITCIDKWFEKNITCPNCRYILK
jgi:hypothetical protein